jgi:hypothetical protein
VVVAAEDGAGQGDEPRAEILFAFALPHVLLDLPELLAVGLEQGKPVQQLAGGNLDADRPAQPSARHLPAQLLGHLREDAATASVGRRSASHSCARANQTEALRGSPRSRRR